MSGKILLVEDDFTSAKLTSELLSRAGYECYAEPTVRGAERRLLDENFEIVLLDLGLPDSHGLDGLRRVQRITSVPVIILTGRLDEEIADQALKAGAQDYLLKDDITTRVLERAISYALSRHSFLSKIAQVKHSLKKARASQ